MSVRRIVPNLSTDDPAALSAFYARALGVAQVMDLGFIVTLATDGAAPAADLQISLASEGGSGTPVPAVSVEVDDFDATLARIRATGAAVTYGPVTEPWGVRRFFFRDPAGNLVNVLQHLPGRP